MKIMFWVLLDAFVIIFNILISSIKIAGEEIKLTTAYVSIYVKLTSTKQWNQST